MAKLITNGNSFASLALIDGILFAIYDNLANKHLIKKSSNRCHKTFISHIDLIISVLREPNDTKIGIAKDQNWIKDTTLHSKSTNIEDNFLIKCKI